MFGNGGRAEWYIGSADLMERNLDRRVEVVTPVEDHEAQARLARIIEVMLADDRRSWQLQPDGTLDPDGGAPVRRGHDRHLRRAQGGRRDGGRARRRPAPAGRRGRLDGSARVTDGIAQRPIEVELKYRMSGVGAGRAPARGGRARRAVRPSGRPTDVLHEDRYLDTPDGALAAAGYAGRLRSTDGGTIITLKGLQRQDDGGAAHRREELEGPADPSRPPAEWPAERGPRRGRGDRRRPAARGARRAPAAPSQAAVRDGRHGRRAVASTTSRSSRGGRVVERFAELEAELREGDEAVLEPLAELLAEIEELVPAETSKLERAMEAVRRERAAEADGSATYDEAAAEAVELDAPDEAMPSDDGDVADGGSSRSIEEELAVGLDAPDEDRRRRARATTRRSVHAATRGRPGAPGGARRRGAGRGPGAARRRRRAGGAHDRAPARTRRRPDAASPSRASRRQDAGRPHRRPPRRGRPQGAPVPPRPDGRARGGHPRGQGRRGAPRHARRDAAPAGGVAGVRRRLRPEADGPPPAPAQGGRPRPRRGPRPRRADRGRRGLPEEARLGGRGRRSSRCSPSGARSATPRASC